MDLRKKFIVLANWKMHKTIRQSINYVKALSKGCQHLDNTIEIILCIPFTALVVVSKEVRISMISIGAQNVHEQIQGAYTGEISSLMLADAGSKYCLVGHSERRHYFSETDALVNQKGRVLHKVGVTPIVCIGETLNEKGKGLTFNKLERQVIKCFDGFSFEEMTKTVILYEPIWAIGTGKAEKPQQIQETHGFIRQMLEKIYSKETALKTRIIYGGSVKFDNVAAIIEGKDIDGVGIGSASLDVHNFLRIAQCCSLTISNRKKSNTILIVRGRQTKQ